MSNEQKMQDLDRPASEELTADQAEEAQGGIGEQYGLRPAGSIINSLEFNSPNLQAKPTIEIG